MTKRIYIAPSSQIHNVGYYKIWNTNEGKNCNRIVDYLIERLGKFNCKIFRGYIGTSLYENEDKANALECDSYYAIHTNAASDPSANGVVCLRQTSAQLSPTRRGKSTKMADALRDAIVSMGRNDRGVKGRLNSSGGEYYADLRRPNMPSVILEIDFHTNKEATYWLTHNKKKIGYAIANAIVHAEQLYMYRLIINEDVPIRTGAGRFFEQVGTAKSGEAYKAYDEEVSAAGTVWANIGIGWINMARATKL